ncbi:MAG: ABC transporter permease subunit [Planctomycetaceae bacterium]|nr:ABC transporter permease subunit [Planctomycetaceae bacterium]
MNGYLAILRRELAGLFLQPLAWFLLAVALLLQGLFYSAALGGLFAGDTAGALTFALGGGVGFWVLMAVLPPLITMRMVSEEARSGLLEFLLTAPVRDSAVILGKASAATLFFALVWCAAPLYAVLLAVLGVEVDWGQVLWGYAGALVVSALFCSAGLFASALSATPALAAFIAFSIGVVLLALPSLGLLDPYLAPETAREIFSKFDVLARHQASFLRGALDTAHLVFFLTWIALFLFLATRLLEMRRWR